MRLGFRIALLILVLFGCRKPIQEEKTILKPIQEVKYPFNYIEDISKQLNYPLKSSESEKEVRLWVNFERYIHAELLILKDSNSTTSLTKIIFKDNHVQKKFKVDSFKVRSESPPISAEVLINNLYFNDFRTLVTQPDSITRRIADGTTHVLELKDSSYYKVISYNMPHHFDDANHKTFMRLVKELEQAMNWTYDSLPQNINYK